MMTGRIRRRGFTFIELLAVTSIIAILAGAAVPMAKIAIKREKEIELRRNLRFLREAIDEYKRLADEKRIEVEEESEGYPPDLEILVNGVEVKETGTSGTSGPSGLSSTSQKASTKIMKFLRRIPLDPMTKSTDWGLRSYQDESDSDSWGEENVYDVYTKSNATALDGTKYKDW